MPNRAFLDTCVLVDLSVPVRPRHKRAKETVDSLARRSTIYISASSLKDAYYVICRHYHNEKAARDITAELRNAFNVAGLTVPVVDFALASDEPDFEDALIRAAAETIGCDLLVTADKEAFKNSSVANIMIID